MASIIYADYYVSSSRVSIEKYFERQRHYLSASHCNNVESLCKYVKAMIGLNDISVINKGSIIEICDTLLRNFFEKTRINPLDVDYVIGNDYRIFRTDSGMNILYYLQKIYGLNNASIFSLEEACSGSVVAIEFASKMLDEKRKYIILFALYLADNKYRFQYNTWIEGDGAGILVIDNSNKGYKIVDYSSKSFGTKSYEIFHNSIRTMSLLPLVRESIKSLKLLLKNNGLCLDDIHVIIPQNLGINAYPSIYSRLLGIPESKFFMDNITSGGHIYNVDTIRNLKDYFDKHDLPDKAYLLIHSATIRQAGDSNHFILLQHKK